MNGYDRCDSCTAAAQVRVRKTVVPATLEELEFSAPKHYELDFCGHHAHAYAAQLDAQGFTTVARREAAPGDLTPA